MRRRSCIVFMLRCVDRQTRSSHSLRLSDRGKDCSLISLNGYVKNKGNYYFLRNENAEITAVG